MLGLTFIAALSAWQPAPLAAVDRVERQANYAAWMRRTPAQDRAERLMYAQGARVKGER